jgi:hypothetical protein
MRPLRYHFPLSLLLGLVGLAVCTTGCERADSISGPDDPGSGNGDTQTATLSDIRISEVHEQEQWVELVNTGDGSVDISDGWICVIGLYDQIRDLTVVAGDTDLTLDPGGSVAVEWDEITAESGAVSFYRSQGFGDAENIVDYVRWGADSGGGRESVAASAGIWNQGDFVEATAANATVSFFGNDLRDNDNPDSWGAGIPSPASPNVRR